LLQTDKSLNTFTVKGISSAFPILSVNGSKIQIPNELVNNSGLFKYINSACELYLPKITPDFQISKQDVEKFRLLNAYTNNRPISSRLPFSYQVIPSPIRNFVASIIGHIKKRQESKWGAFPAWPLDLSSDFLADIAGFFSPFANSPTPVLLTHDIDSLEGLQNLPKWFLPLEEEVGATSTNYVVPCAWTVDYDILDDIKARGHEIGVHGYDHSNLTPFVSEQVRRKRLNAASNFVNKYNVAGYRAPSLLRTAELLHSLADYYQYDSSIPTSGGLFPIPNNGCASARPFKIGNIMEIPLSMPRDGSLRFLGHSPNEILKIWSDCATKISESGGVVVLLTHCEKRFSGNPKMLESYKKFLYFIQNAEQFEWSTPQRVLRRFNAFESSSS